MEHYAEMVTRTALGGQNTRGRVSHLAGLKHLFHQPGAIPREVLLIIIHAIMLQLTEDKVLGRTPPCQSREKHGLQAGTVNAFDAMPRVKSAERTFETVASDIVVGHFGE
jgi:hypothetical protein